MLIALRVACRSLLMRAAIATLGFRRVRAALRLRTVEQAERAPGAPPVLSAGAERALHIALRTLKLPGLRTSCLPVAVTLERVCANVGIEAEVVIGVDTSQGFRAHAWVEIDGWPVGATEAGARAWRPLGRFARETARTKVPA